MKRLRYIIRNSVLSAAACLMSVIGTVSAEQQKDFSLSFSPDGKQMVYYSYRGNQLPDLFIANADGSEERQLTQTKEIWEITPQWSPGGDLIIFSAGPSMRDLEIFSIRPSGSERQQLTDGQGNGHVASWHPAGDSIIYSRFISPEESNVIYLDLKSGKERQLTKSGSGHHTNAVWSPNGKRVAFASKNAEKSKTDLYVSDPHFTDIKKITNDEYQQDFVTWTPDSKHLVYSIKVGNSTNDLYSVNIQDETVTQITDVEDEHVYFSAFSPDGKFLYMDKGNWNKNFFAYRAKWTGEKVMPVQVGGKHWIDTIAQIEKAFLSPMIGKWKGVSTYGSAKGHFEEIVDYRWGPNKKSILVDMEMYWDSQKFGEAKGLLGLDTTTQKIYYNLVMDDGTVVMQRQENAGEPAQWEMDVIATGDGSRFLNHFKVKYYRNKNGTWKSDILVLDDEGWKLMDVHEFSLAN